MVLNGERSVSFWHARDNGLGLDAFETGKRLLPMSVTMLIAALLGPKLAARLAPRLVVQVGLAAVVVAALVLVGTIDAELNETGFKLSLALFGVGAGLMMSQSAT